MLTCNARRSDPTSNQVIHHVARGVRLLSLDDDVVAILLATLLHDRLRLRRLGLTALLRGLLLAFRRLLIVAILTYTSTLAQAILPISERMQLTCSLALTRRRRLLRLRSRCGFSFSSLTIRGLLASVRSGELRTKNRPAATRILARLHFCDLLDLLPVDLCDISGCS